MLKGFVRGAGLELVGLVVAVAALQWGFSGIARRNICRLRQLSDKGCFFAFQAWKSYLIIAFMIALGITLSATPRFPGPRLPLSTQASAVPFFWPVFITIAICCVLLRTANRQQQTFYRKSRNGN